MPPQVGRVGGGDSPQDWFYSLPPVTRTLFVGVLSLTCGTSFGILNPANLALLWDPIIHKFEIWRLGSDFFFYGGFSFPFLIQLYLLVQYASRYEVSPFDTGAGGSSADFAWMLCLGMAMLSLFGFMFQMVFLGQALSFMILYVWTRKNPDEQTSIFGFKVQAFYLPWALLAFNLLIGNPIFKPVLGIVSGHVYYFLHFIAPNAYGYNLVKTPAFMIESFGGTPRPPPGQAARGGRPVRPQAGHSWGTGNVLGAN